MLVGQNGRIDAKPAILVSRTVHIGTPQVQQKTVYCITVFVSRLPVAEIKSNATKTKSKRAPRAELHSIAASVPNGTSEAAAVVNMAVHTHISMISLWMVDGLGPHLVSTADRISARLGYRRADEL